jgi:amino acid adenylation domain-containing protein
MDSIAKRIAALSPEQRILFERQLKKKGLNNLQTQVIPKRKAANCLPLSFSQARLWFLDQVQPGNPFYNLAAIVRLEGLLNVAVLEQTFNEIIRRHEILRTTFPTVEGQPIQLIAPVQFLTIPITDLRKLPATEQEQEIDRLATRQAQQPFDLTQAPLLRVHLLQLSETKHAMLLTMHHIVSDGWSKGVLIREVAALYEAFASGRPSPLPELPIQYGDFAIWQRERSQPELLEKQLSYWKQQLNNLPILHLPTDRPRPTTPTFEGAWEPVVLSTTLKEALNTLSQQQGVTLFMTLVAAFKILLYRYTGLEDIVIGSSIASRNQAEIEGAIGFFINMLVLRTNLAENPSFLNLLSRVKEVTLGAYAHQDVPFEMLVELQQERNLTYNPLFQVSLTLNNAPMPPLQVGNLTLNVQEIDNKTSKFDLSLYLFDTAEGLNGWFEYSTALFDAATIRRMVGHFQTLLESIIANPSQRISNLPILTAAERHNLLVKWNDTKTDYPDDQGVHQLFEAQVEATPDAVAVVFQNEQLTYRQLNERANQLAHYLQKLGVAPNSLVGICVERSLDMVIALLGILKAGFAYVPLDPAYPSSRIAFMLEDAQVALLVTQSQLVPALPSHNAIVVCLDTDSEQINQGDAHNPNNTFTPENLAYVIYTSGSTGTPKGVQIPFGALVNFLTAMRQTLGLNEQDILLGVTTLSFDIAALELFLPLIVGARVAIASRQVATDGTELLKQLLEKNITVMQATPATWRLLLAAGWQGSPGLKILCGGEALDTKLADELRLRGEQVWNLYGPTETTIWSIIDRVEAGAIAIGRPIGNTQIYILDPNLQPVPVGVIGELYIGGAGVAKGYLNRSELTAERFISNPFEIGDSRVYKTGDLARYLPNGNIEYLGRSDFQVKLRGFRIELLEIEATLNQHPEVRETAVVLREDEPGNRRLVAYVVPKAPLMKGGLGGSETPETTQLPNTCVNPDLVPQLRSYLQAKLPEYFIPSAFVILETLPLTPNGKIDRRSLPAPDTTRPELEAVYTAPSTPIEKVLAQVWAQVLNLEKVGIHDNFFALGGDSIRSIQILYRAQEQGLNFSVSQLFQYQTIHKLAQEIQRHEANNANCEQVQPFSLITVADREKLSNDIEDAYPLAMLQTGMLFHSAYSVDSNVYHDVFSFHLKATFDLPALQASVQQLATRHPVLRTSFDLSNFSEPLQLVHPTACIPLQVEDLRHLAPNAQEKVLAVWMESEKCHKFDWTQPPLLRFQVHRLSEETFQFALSFHHAILDGWSMVSLLNELFHHYFYLLGEQIDSTLASPAIAYREFVALQRQAIASQEHRCFWMEKLHSSTITQLPRWNFTAQSTGVAAIRVPISPEVSHNLKQLAVSANVPLKSVLLAAHLRVLSLLSGQSDVVTGLSSNSRPETTDGDRILGLFLNTLPFRFKLKAGTWLDLVRQTFDAERELLPHRRYPLPQIQRDLGQQRLFEVSFNFTHFHISQRLYKLSSLEVLGIREFGFTDFVLLANFSLDVNSSQLQLSVNCNTADICHDQAEEIGSCYAQILAAMAKNPQESSQHFDLNPHKEMQRQKLTTIKRKLIVETGR